MSGTGRGRRTEELPRTPPKLGFISGIGSTMVGTSKRKARAAAGEPAQLLLRSYLVPTDLFGASEHPATMKPAPMLPQGTLGL